MEFVHEKQTAPAVLSFLVTFLVVAVSYVGLWLAYPGQAVVNRYYWYMTRAAGFTAYELLAITVLLGVSSTSALWDRWKLRKLVTQMHQYLPVLMAAFLFLHLWGLHFDRSVPFTWLSLFVPLQAPYRQFATGLGILSMYGVLILTLTSYVRRHIGSKVWRSIHLLSFPLFVVTTMHGLLAGTDAHTGWAFWLYGTPLALFAWLVALRVRKRT